MIFNYEQTKKELETYINDFEELFATCNENMSSYELDNLYYKLYIIANKFLIAGFSPLNRIKQENNLKKAKFGLTLLAYSATASSIFLTPDAPLITLSSLFASLTLSYRRRIENSECQILYAEELQDIINIIGKFNDIIDKDLTLIDKQIQKLNNIEEINNLHDNEKAVHLASKNLLDMLYGTEENISITEDIRDQMIKLIQKECKTDETDFEKLLNIALEDFDNIDNEFSEYDKKANKLIKKRYRIIV